MDPILLIFCVIALVAFTVLCIVLIMWVLDLKKHVNRTVVVLDTTSRDIQEIKHRLLPVLDEARATLISANSALQNADRAILNADREIVKAGQGIDTFVAIANDVRRLEQSIVSKVQGPLEDVTSILNGAMKGLTTFARQLFKR